MTTLVYSRCVAILQVLLTNGWAKRIDPVVNGGLYNLYKPLEMAENTMGNWGEITSHPTYRRKDF